MTPATIQNIINRLQACEKNARHNAEECYHARVQLENFYSPAPKGDKTHLSKEKKLTLVTNFRKKLTKAL